MTDPAAPEPPGGADGAARGLAALCAVPREEFASGYWGRRPLLTRAEELPSPTHGFDADAVDELLSRRALRTPFLRMARDGATLDARELTLGGGVGAAVGDQVSEDKVLRLFADGATIVLQGLHRSWEPVSRSARSLAADLGHPVQVNAYVTPPQNRGFDDHYDVHDVFVVQVEGEKHWRVRPPVLDLPHRGEPWTDRREAVREAAAAEPVLDAVLRPGDCLYLPRGWLHSATALGGTSIHLTFGVHVWTGRTLADDLLAAVGRRLDDDPALRAALPVGVDALDPATTPRARDALRDSVVRALDAVTDEELAAALARRVRAAERAEPIGVLAQHRSAAAQVGPRWRVRQGLAGRWEGEVLVSRVGRFTAGPGERAVVEAVLAGGSGADALPEDLRRRLVLAGLLVLDA
ncbi:cupin domain-containing protein [Phycicoccus sonneratiae]|uniref:Cupin-like domain-containing protein n=1 Tax=Phycicoccus sonneratiae TaxID=2807628 RepID=A0ABS2CJ40_9MICO|nr:cupin domain-containing protein [Phycicoccus sonneraticus]MBM6399191.1 cupin-like domain-containing protein [Phycicoccus sonneraticus]